MGSNHFQIADILSEYLSNGLMTRGEGCELIGRLLLILQALDAAVVEKSLRDRINPIKFSVGIPVIEFLVALFTDNYKILCQTISDNMPGATLQDAFQNGVVYFTHWGKAADSNIMNDDWSWKAISRGEAIDLILSVLFDRRKT
jgi:hypothetical protein